MSPGGEARKREAGLLARLLSARAEATRLALQAAMRRRQAVEAEMAGLAAQHRAWQAAMPPEPAVAAATDAAWHRLHRQRRAGLERRLAALREAEAAARAQAVLAFGREQAAADLAARIELQALRQAAWRARSRDQTS